MYTSLFCIHFIKYCYYSKRKINKVTVPALEDLASDPATTLLLLCNPMNPLGRVLDEDELKDIARICIANDVVICADEIHGGAGNDLNILLYSEVNSFSHTFIHL